MKINELAIIVFDYESNLIVSKHNAKRQSFVEGKLSVQ